MPGTGKALDTSELLTLNTLWNNEEKSKNRRQQMVSRNKLFYTSPFFEICSLNNFQSTMEKEPLFIFKDSYPLEDGKKNQNR